MGTGKYVRVTVKGGLSSSSPPPVYLTLVIQMSICLKSSAPVE